MVQAFVTQPGGRGFVVQARLTSLLRAGVCNANKNLLALNGALTPSGFENLTGLAQDRSCAGGETGK
jgi:hypothetical protein